MIEYKGYQFEDYHYGTMRVSQYQKMIDLLEERKPKRICEMGTGQSTRIFEQYCQKYGASLVSIEHKHQYRRKDTIMFQCYEFFSFSIEDEQFPHCSQYGGMELWLRDQDPFDFVLCDGPYGCGFRSNYEYSRPQIVLFPMLNKLTDESIVIMHDSGRQAEANTLVRLEKIFDKKKYSFTKETDEEYDQMTTYYVTKNK